MRIPAPHIVEEALKRERPVQEERPRVHVPQATPEYLRWVKEEAMRREKENSEKEDSRGVVVFQM